MKGMKRRSGAASRTSVASGRRPNIGELLPYFGAGRALHGGHRDAQDVEVSHRPEAQPRVEGQVLPAVDLEIGRNPIGIDAGEPAPREGRPDPPALQHRLDPKRPEVPVRSPRVVRVETLEGLAPTASHPDSLTQ